MPTTLDVETYQDPASSSTPRASYPPITDCERQTFQPVAQARADHERSRLAIGPRPRVHDPAGAEHSRLALAAPDRRADPPRRADDQPRRRRRAERLHATPRPSSASRRPSHCPDNAKVGTIVDQIRRAPGRSSRARSTSAQPKPGQPVPAVHDRRRLRHPRQADRRAAPRPEDRPDHAPSSKTCRSCPSKSSRCTSSPPIAGSWRRRPTAPSTRSRRDLFPWNTCSPTQSSQFGVSVTAGPRRQPLPGRYAALRPAARGRHLQLQRRRLLQLHPEARPRRRRPVPRRPQLHDAARA